jgi:hypothetical protein
VLTPLITGRDLDAWREELGSALAHLFANRAEYDAAPLAELLSELVLSQRRQVQVRAVQLHEARASHDNDGLLFHLSSPRIEPRLATGAGCKHSSDVLPKALPVRDVWIQLVLGDKVNCEYCEQPSVRILATFSPRSPRRRTKVNAAR